MIGDINREAKEFEHLSDAFKLKKDYLTAYNMHLRYVQLADSLLNIEKFRVSLKCKQNMKRYKRAANQIVK